MTSPVVYVAVAIAAVLTVAQVAASSHLELTAYVWASTTYGFGLVGAVLLLVTSPHRSALPARWQQSSLVSAVVIGLAIAILGWVTDEGVAWVAPYASGSIPADLTLTLTLVLGAVTLAAALKARRAPSWALASAALVIPYVAHAILMTVLVAKEFAGGIDGWSVYFPFVDFAAYSLLMETATLVVLWALASSANAQTEAIPTSDEVHEANA